MAGRAKVLVAELKSKTESAVAAQQEASTQAGLVQTYSAEIKKREAPTEVRFFSGQCSCCGRCSFDWQSSTSAPWRSVWVPRLPAMHPAAQPLAVLNASCAAAYCAKPHAALGCMPSSQLAGKPLSACSAVSILRSMLRSMLRCCMLHLLPVCSVEYSLHDVMALILPQMMVLAGLRVERDTPELRQLRMLRDAASQAAQAASRLMQERSEDRKSVRALNPGSRLLFKEARQAAFAPVRQPAHLPQLTCLRFCISWLCAALLASEQACMQGVRSRLCHHIATLTVEARAVLQTMAARDQIIWAAEAQALQNGVAAVSI